MYKIMVFYRVTAGSLDGGAFGGMQLIEFETVTEANRALERLREGCPSGAKAVALY